MGKHYVSGIPKTYKDAYEYLKKNNWKDTKGVELTSSLYRKIIFAIHKHFRDILDYGGEVLFPMAGGRLYITCMDLTRWKTNNKYTVVNWPATSELWKKDPEAKARKERIFCTNTWYYFITYNVADALYKNKIFVNFAPGEFFIRSVTRNGLNNLIPKIYIYGDQIHLSKADS